MEQNHILISVIVTVRNEERTIGDCINSLINQSLQKNLYEVIIVDDHSTDRTPEIIKELENKSSLKILLVQQEGEGISNARNTGIKYSKGNILAFIDGDAFAQKNWLEEYLKCFKNADQKLGFIYGPVIVSNGKNKVAKSLYILYYSLLGAHGANIAYNRSAIENIGCFDEEFKGRGDEVVVNLKLSKAGYTSKECTRAVVHHELPTSAWGYLKIRYKEGLNFQKIIQKYCNNQEKRHYNLRLGLKFFTVVAIILSIVYLLALNVFLALLFFISASIGMLVVYKIERAKIENENLLTVIIGTYVVSMGHVLEVIGEIVQILKYKKETIWINA